MIFKKKNKTSRRAGPSPAVPSDGSFYKRPEDYALEEVPGGFYPSARRTSLHEKPAREGEDNRSIGNGPGKLFFRWILIVLAVAGGFFVLRYVLNLLAEPSEKEKQSWNYAIEKMDGVSQSGNEARPGQAAVFFPDSGGVDGDFMQEQLERWELAERHFRAAESLARRNINEEAVSRLKQALTANPDHRAAQQLLQDIYFRSGAYGEAVLTGLRLLGQDSRNRNEQARLLVALKETGQTEAGLTLAEKMLETGPNDAAVLEAAAGFHLELGDPDSAENLYRRILENNSRNVPALQGMAAILSNRQQWDEAVSYYRDLVSLEPSEENLYALALCYAYLNESERTVALITQATSLYEDKRVAAWIRNPGFDNVRETAEFRTLADRLVGAETRAAIEGLRRQEVEEAAPRFPETFQLPRDFDLRTIQPGR